MRKLFTKLASDATAVTAIEYAMIASIISIAAVSFFATIGTTVSGMFASVGNGL